MTRFSPWLCVVALLGLGAGAQAETFTVMRAADAGVGTLREAIGQSNANGVADTITFDAALSGRTIFLATPLPPLTGGDLTIDGDLNADGIPDIALDGSAASGDGLRVRSAGNTIRGLRIIRCEGAGIRIEQARPRHNLVAGCFLGTDRTGAVAFGNLYGVLVGNGARRVTIGGPAAVDRNLISGNHEAGVLVAGAGNVRILNNLIGTDLSGQLPLGNGAGVMISDSYSCYLGDGTPNGRNVISANGEDGPPGGRQVQAGSAAAVLPSELGGVLILGGTSHRILGNYLGTNLDGSAPIPNDMDVVLTGTTDITVGGASTRHRNVMASGVEVRKSRAVRILGNHVGVNARGNALLDQSYGSFRGVSLFDAIGCLIGGSSPAVRNVISGVGNSSVQVDGGRGNMVWGNYLGLNRNGTKGLGDGYGVYVTGGAVDTQVGGAQAETGNVLAGGLYNYGTGVYVDNAPGTVVQRNLIGFNAAGDTPIRSFYTGVQLYTTGGDVTVGGRTRALGNRIFVAPGYYGINQYGWGTYRILNNTVTGAPAFGLGGPAQSCILVQGSSSYPSPGRPPRIVGNVLSEAQRCLRVYGLGTSPIVMANEISKWTEGGVYIEEQATPNLGDLGNTPTNDDGRNLFSDGVSGYDVVNTSPSDIKAEGNDWGGETVGANIDATHVYDKLDNASHGRVDFDPLLGGSSPTSVGGTIQVAGLTAVPASRGAEIVFTLSAPAEVQAEVLNIAGRPVAALPPISGQTGLNRLSWSGLSAQGTAAPGGVYLIRLVARTPSGAQSSGLTTFQLHR